MKTLPSGSTYARWLALVRIVTGAMWIAHALPKFLDSATFMPPHGFMPKLVAHGAQHGSRVFAPFFANVVAPNMALFAELVRLGELLTGIALLFGIFTRAGGLVGIVLPIMYVSAKGPLLSYETLATPDFTMLVLSGINLVLPTGRVFGIDALLGRPRRRLERVHAEFVPEPPLITPPPPTGPSAPTSP
jgi:uncharacterized membrane protein YphA (DoxX/SURF4 family)